MDWTRLPPPVSFCCRRLWQAGWEAYPVGGCIRDLLLGRLPADWDVASSAPPEVVTGLFPHTAPTGLRHGTVTVLLEDAALEVTALRSESAYRDGRHPETVAFGVSLEEDLARRDFTINAMALDRNGQVIDPFGGRNDLARGVVRCVGDPDRRFQEDALRMLRAVRFSAQFGFSLSPSTADALARCAGGLDRISGERLKAEMEKILLSPAPERASLPVALGMLERFGAAARAHNLDGLRQVPATAEARWRYFCSRTGLDITALPVERRIRRFVLRPEGPELALTGRELYDLGLRGGEIGEARRTLLRHVLAHPGENSREKLLDVLKRGL